MKIYIDQNQSNLITIKYVCGTGSINEPKLGIAHFTEHMLFKGTQRRNKNQINNDVSKIGGYLNAYTCQDRTCFFINSPIEYKEQALDIINDIYWNSIIPYEEMEIEREIIIKELKDNDAETLCYDNLRNFMHNDNNRKYIAGTVESVKRITRKDIIDYIHNYYTHENTALIISSNISNDFIKEKNSNSLIRNIEEYKKQNMNNRLIIDYQADLEMSYLVFAIRGVMSSSKERYIQDLCSYILGHDPTSRLFKVLREEKALAYSIYTFEQYLHDTSFIYGYAVCDDFKLVHKYIVQEINRLKNEYITEEELQVIKALYKGELLRSNETTEDRTCLYEDNFIYQTNFTLNNIIRIIDNISINDIRHFCQKYFNKYNIIWSVVTSK